MGNQSDSGGVSGAEGQDKPPSVWVRATTAISTLWPIPWPMANGILLILLVGWLVPLVPEALHGVGQGIAVAWNWLRLTGDGPVAPVTNAETIRNLSLILGGPLALVALWLAWRRTYDARRQTKTQIDQVQIAISGQRSDRFQTAIQNMESKNEGSKIAAIQELVQLRRDNFIVYDLVVRRIFAEYISNRVQDIGKDLRPKNQNPARTSDRMMWDYISEFWSEPESISSIEIPTIYATTCPISLIIIESFSHFNFENVAFSSIIFGNSNNAPLFYSCYIRQIIFHSDIDIESGKKIPTRFFNTTVEKVRFPDGFMGNRESYKILFDENCIIPDDFY